MVAAGMARKIAQRRRTMIVAASATLTFAFASAAEPKIKDLADLSLEQLGDIEVTSVSRRTERLGDAAASIFVITAADIRRSGVSSLPEALRLAPNLQVARVTSRAPRGWSAR